MLAPHPGGSAPDPEENPESDSGLIQSSSFSLERLILLVIAGNADLAGAVDTAASRGAPSDRAHAQHAVPVRILLGTGDRDPPHQPAENRVKSRVNFHPGVCLLYRNFAQLCDAQGFWENVLDSFSCFYIEIAYSNFNFCGACTLSFLVYHTISAKRPHISITSNYRKTGVNGV